VASSRVTRILITGGDGILAHALRAYFPLADYYGRQTCDVTRPEQVRTAFQNTKPELVIHCAAQTSHNAEPFSYVQANIQGTANVAAQAKKCGARSEQDPVVPVNTYAASKYAGECVVRTLGNALVVRGSWYSRLELSHAATDAFTSRLPVDRASYYIAILATSGHTGTVNIAGPRRSIFEIALEFNERVIPVSRSQIHCGYEYPADTSLNTERLTRWLAT
jgi:dTDP-4-dehydrorhamnose reductase